MELLVAHGADLAATDDLGTLPHHLFAAEGHLPLLRWVAAHRGPALTARLGAPWWRVPDGGGRTAADWAGAAGHAHVVEWLGACG